MMTITTSTFSTPNLLNIKKTPKHISCHHIKTHKNTLYQPYISHLTLSKHNLSYPFHATPTFLKASPLVASAAAEDAAAVSNVDSAETTQDIVAAATTTTTTVAASGDDSVNIIISVLLFIAFITLSVLTIRVIYIAVTDFLQKREKEKFEKEEAEKAKKKGGKKKVGARPRDGPRGFGQKIEDDFDD